MARERPPKVKIELQLDLDDKIWLENFAFDQKTTMSAIVRGLLLDLKKRKQMRAEG